MNSLNTDASTDIPRVIMHSIGCSSTPPSPPLLYSLLVYLTACTGVQEVRGTEPPTVGQTLASTAMYLGADNHFQGTLHKNACATIHPSTLLYIHSFPVDGICLLPKRWKGSSHLRSVCKTFDII